MPTLNLNTNVPVDAVTSSDILKDCSRVLAKIIGKPESYVMISLHGGVPMSFAGSEEPAAYGEVISIGGLGPGVNGKLSSALAEILESKLSVDSSRFYIKFYDVQVHWLQWNDILRCQEINTVKQSSCNLFVNMDTMMLFHLSNKTFRKPVLLLDVFQCEMIKMIHLVIP
ncbi:Macrophage migration inhibitory factor [Rhynchospora pubera]|uniref:L-dopachrome isomerase n=1 Tax=Rhynchospora pubera TaxID=906938 RepID=A0AAV8CH19_9POAL|nr:Macrophage migration inhibitory factor [Rhynchospora pubera]